MAHADLILSNPNRIEKARKLNSIEKRTKDLEDVMLKESNTLSRSIVNMWKNFEDLCMTLSRLDGIMTEIEIENLTAWHFYRKKSYISKINKPRPKNGAQED